MPQPKLLSKPWASDGLKNNIPAERNGGLAQEAATYAEGFPSVTMTPISVGGKPPSGKDMNGVLYEISAHTVWQNQGGRYRFDQAFCDAIGGYPKGAVLINDTLDTEYISLVDANTHNPNSGNNTGKWAIHAGKGLKASTTQAGSTQLSSATNSNSEEQAATSKAVKTAYDKAVDAAKLGVPVGAVVGYPEGMTPPGYLKADGGTFERTAYPDLYAALGNRNRLPDLRQSDIGMVAYFAADDIPNGWLPFDDIGSRVTQAAYPKLHALLTAQYGSISAVPKMVDRFVRNAANGLVLGEVQADALQSHKHGLAVAADAAGDDLWFEQIPKSAFGIPKGVQAVAIRDMRNAIDTTTDVMAHSAPFNHPNLVSQPNLTQQAYVQGETRPKAIVLKACIKAADGRDGVVYWIKAFGAVANAGMLDASRLAQGLQEKEDKGHTHRMSDIGGLHDALDELQGKAQKAANGWCKLPNGMILQWGFKPANGNWDVNQSVAFPVAFPSVCLNVSLTPSIDRIDTDHAAEFGVHSLSATGFKFFTWLNPYLGHYWTAIGY